MNRKPLATSSIVVVTAKPDEGAASARFEWKFWAPFLLAVASPFLAHYLDSQTQKYMFTLNRDQALKMDMLEQSRREYELKLTALTEFEAAVTEWKKQRTQFVADQFLLITWTAISGVNGELAPIDDAGGATSDELLKQFQSDSTELTFATLRLRASVSKASILYGRTWLSDDRSFLKHPTDTGTTNQGNLYIKEIGDAYRPVITDYFRKSTNAKPGGPLPNLVTAIQPRVGQIKAEYQDEWNKFFAADDAVITKIYADCLQGLNMAAK